MKLITCVLAFVFSCSSWAQVKVTVASEFQSPGAKVSNCNGTVIANVTCTDPSTGRNQLTWTNNTFSDWAGTVLRAQINIESPNQGTVTGHVHFIYLPAKNLEAVALKQSSGGQDLVITGQTDDLTDVEGRRIISVSPNRPIEFDIPISESYTTPGQAFTVDYMIELEPAEYLGP